MRSYLSAMTGQQYLTVDEETRRKIYDIEQSQKDPQNPNALKSIIDGDKVMFDFSKLSSNRLDFQVRTGSLIQSRQEEQRQSIQELLVPVSQSIGALSDENRPAFEANLMQMIERLFELSDIDFAQTSGQRINDKLIIDALKAAYIQIMDQNKAIEQLQQLAIGSLPQGQNQQVTQNSTLPEQPTIPQQPPSAPEQLEHVQPQPQQQEQIDTGSSQLPPEIMQQLLAQQQQEQAAAEQQVPPEQVQ